MAARPGSVDARRPTARRPRVLDAIVEVATGVRRWELLPEVDGAVSLRRPAVLGLLAACTVVVAATQAGQAFVSHLPGAWYFGTPGGPFGSLTHSGGRAPLPDVVAVYGGLAALAWVWLGTCRALGRRAVAVHRVMVVVGIWALPFLLGPPLFSRDLFSYAGQGEMVSHHLDPYLYGTGVLGYTRFNVLAGPLWANTPSPYGPTFLWLDGLAAELSGHAALPAVVLLRLLAVGGVMLAAAGLPVLARAAGRDAGQAVLFGVGSPLVLTTLLGGGHNDALMIGLVVAGLAVARRVGPAPGIALCALAGGVKAPALLAVVFLGWNWSPRRGLFWRAAGVAGGAGIAAATLGALSWLSGVGWGWVRTVGAPGKVFTGVTPVDGLSEVLTGAAHLVHLPLQRADVREVVAAAALTLCAVAGLWLLWHSEQRGTVRSLGLALVALALLSPILWPWYLGWGLVPLAAVAHGPLRRLVAGLTVAGTLVGAGSVRHLLGTLLSGGAPGSALLLAGVAASAVAILVWVHRRGEAAAGGYCSARMAASSASGSRTTGPRVSTVASRISPLKRNGAR
jgi:alpha-1,6-mannosyltransferase